MSVHDGSLIVVGYLVKIEPEELAKWEMLRPVACGEPDTEVEVGYSKSIREPLTLEFQGRKAKLTEAAFILFQYVNELYRTEGQTEFEFLELSDFLFGKSSNAIELEIYKCHPNDWRLFSKHHYLNSKKLSTGAQCYVALWNKIPVSFCAVMPSVGHKGFKRISRIVTLPDYQGVGIGKTLLNFVADRYKKAGHRITIGTSHPAMIQSLLKAKQWVFRETAGNEANRGKTKGTHNLRNSVVIGRKIAYFEYVL